MPRHQAPKLIETLDLVLAAQAARRGQAARPDGGTAPRRSLVLALCLSLLLCAGSGAWHLAVLR